MSRIKPLQSPLKSKALKPLEPVKPIPIPISKDILTLASNLITLLTEESLQDGIEEKI